jgi:signal peptidase I
MKLFVLNGPNLNLLGIREPDIYGRQTFADLEAFIREVCARENIEVECFQSNHEGAIVDRIGAALEEPYAREATWLAEGVEFPLTVPAGCLFLMGDNRNDSEDSRSADLGPVDSRCVIGKAVFLALPGKTADLNAREWNRVGFLR